MEPFVENAVVLIPARAGSKRIENKSRVLLGEKPLALYSVEFALNDFGGERVYLNTDDELLLEYAETWGITAFPRPAALAKDTTSSGAVLKQFVETLRSNGPEFQWIVLLQPTNPYRPKGLIGSSFQALSASAARSLVAVSPVEQKIGQMKSDGTFEPVNYSFGERSQEMKPRFYQENGLLYITHVSMARSGRVLDEAPLALPVESWHGRIDIDTPEDLEVARALHKRYMDETGHSR